jgi:hypothetical protein
MTPCAEQALLVELTHLTRNFFISQLHTIDLEAVNKTVCGRDVAVELTGTYHQRVLITAFGARFKMMMCPEED